MIAEIHARLKSIADEILMLGDSTGFFLVLFIYYSLYCTRPALSSTIIHYAAVDRSSAQRVSEDRRIVSVMNRDEATLRMHASRQRRLLRCAPCLSALSLVAHGSPAA